MLASGRQRRLDNRVAWSITHLVQAGLLERPHRNATRLTERGRRVLTENQERVDMKVLAQFEDYQRAVGSPKTPVLKDSCPHLES